MSDAPVIHIVNPMWNAFGGSEQRVMQLYSLLRPRAAVYIWSEQGPDPRLSARVPVRRIDATQQPQGGTLVIVGNYYPLGSWLATSYPRRVVFVVNVSSAEAYQMNLEIIASTGVTAEIVYASEGLMERVGMPGRVEPSPIDLARFAPAQRASAASDTFVVGRLSRDAANKHHAEDPRLYTELARRGCDVRVMGGSVLAGAGCPSEVQFLKEGSAPSHEFLQALDCFVYRTSPEWYETYGRVVFEAMACGLPVVVHEGGGYAERIRDGENGLLFDTTERALEQVLRVRDEPGLRARLAAGARETITRLYSAEYWSRLADYYLAPG